MNKKLLLGVVLISGIGYGAFVTHTDYQSGTTITASGQNANENAIITQINGNIDNTNILPLGILNGNIANGTIEGNKLNSNTASFQIVQGTINVITIYHVNTATGPFTDWTSYTPTFTGLGTVSNVSIYWRRIGANVEIQGLLTSGTVGSQTVSMTLPNGITTNSNIIQAYGSDMSVIGNWGAAQNSGNATPMIGDGNDNLVFFGSGSSSSHALSAVTGTSGITSNTTVSVHMSAPIAGWTF